jgi:hypothetical protein
VVTRLFGTVLVLQGTAHIDATHFCKIAFKL